MKSFEPCEKTDCKNFGIWERQDGQIKFDLSSKMEKRKKNLKGKIRGSKESKYWTIMPPLICPACAWFKHQNLYDKE